MDLSHIHPPAHRRAVNVADAEFPKRVIVRVGHPSPEGLAVIVNFGMRAKNSFDFIVFVSADGRAEILGADLLKCL